MTKREEIARIIAGPKNPLSPWDTAGDVLDCLSRPDPETIEQICATTTVPGMRLVVQGIVEGYLQAVKGGK